MLFGCLQRFTPTRHQEKKEQQQHRSAIYMQQNRGIGGLEASMTTPRMFGMVVIGLVGWSLNALARIFERRMQRLYGIDPR